MLFRVVGISLFFHLLAMYSYAGDTVRYDISRFQMRAMDDGSYAGSLSSFWLFKNGTFLLPIYEVDHKDETADRLDLMFGGPISSKGLGYIARYQNYSWEEESFSAGLQYDFHKNDFLNKGLSKFCIKSFIQYYLTSGADDVVGDSEIYMRTQGSCSKKVYYRGVVQYLMNTDKDEQFLTFNDIFFRLGKNVELYLRHQYLSDDNLAYGREGTSFGIGIRLSSRILK